MPSDDADRWEVTTPREQSHDVGKNKTRWATSDGPRRLRSGCRGEDKERAQENSRRKRRLFAVVEVREGTGGVRSCRRLTRLQQ